MRGTAETFFTREKTRSNGTYARTYFLLDSRKLVGNYLGKRDRGGSVNFALISCRFERVSGAGLWTEYNPRRCCIPNSDGSMENVSAPSSLFCFPGLNDFCSLTSDYSFKDCNYESSAFYFVPNAEERFLAKLKLKVSELS